MKGDIYVLASFVIICLFVIWLEWRENKIIDARRTRDFKNLNGECLSYLRHTKDRPFWRIAWVCACLVTVASTVPFMAFTKKSDIDLAGFCVLVFGISLVSAQSALSYYTWHIVCPHYTCSLCEAGMENSEK
jgi:hypothetical protein